MADRIQSVCQPHLDDGGEFHWPATQEGRDALASRMLGACVVAGMDEWTGRAIQRLRAEPQLGLTAEQSAKAEKIVAEAVRGVVFSTLVKLDQFPHAILDIVLSGEEDEVPVASIVAGDINDLHDLIWGW